MKPYTIQFEVSELFLYSVVTSNLRRNNSYTTVTIVFTMDPTPKPNSNPVGSEETVTKLDHENSRFPPGRTQIYEPESTIRGLLTLLGKKHTIAIMYAFACGAGPWRFSELENMLDIAPNTLSARLEELTSVGLLTRHAYNEIPPRVEYENTDKARDLKPMFDELHLWAESHDLESSSDQEVA